MVKKLLGLAVFATVLGAVLSAAPACAGEIPVTHAAVQANCGVGPALMAQPAKGETCSAAQPESLLPGVLEPAVRRGYCHCGCSSVRTCRTSADCGGASCDQTISCC
ncbi:MAG TPA: hypothetical protein VGH73_16340 [Thermoanaerobaculia bacterium]|jgi:hypothetical protein